MQLQKGAVLQNGKYKIESVLGQGGFGITYLAEQVMLKRKVAVKEFFFKQFCERDGTTGHVSIPSLSNTDQVQQFMKKFMKEARTISQMHHSNIIKIYDVFEENDTAYYVMEFIDGSSLSNIVTQRGTIPEGEAVEYIKKVASALEYLHDRKINHLDIKPDNIMVRKSDNEPIVIDFGLAKQYDAYTGQQTSTTPVGLSHGYAPAEQYKPGGVSEFSPQADIYSLGATLYKLISGVTPPHACDLLDEELIFPNTTSPNVKAAILHSLQTSKKRRQESVQAFVGELTGNIAVDEMTMVPGSNDEATMVPGQMPFGGPVASNFSSTSYPPMPPKKNNNTILWALIGVLAVAIVGIGGFLIYSNVTSDPPVVVIEHEEVEDDGDTNSSSTSETTVQEQQPSALSKVGTTTQSAPASSGFTGIPSSPNCTVSGNISGYGSYTLVIGNGSGQISPGVRGKQGKLRGISYDSSTGYITMDAYTMSGDLCGYYAGYLSVTNGQYRLDGSFSNIYGKASSFVMVGR